MTRSDELSDEIIEALATLSNKMLAYDLKRASEVIDDAMITVSGAMADDLLIIQAKVPDNLLLH